MLKKFLLAALLGLGILAPVPALADCPFLVIGGTAAAGSYGCVVMGPGPGGTFPISGTITVGSLLFPYNAAAGQTATAGSFLGIGAWNGTTVDALKDTVAAGALDVGIKNASIPVTQSGTFTVAQGTGAAASAAWPMFMYGLSGTNQQDVNSSHQGLVVDSSLSSFVTGVTPSSTLSGGANHVVKNSAGIFYGATTTTTSTTALICYDNASTNTGTIVGESLASSTAGTALTVPTQGVKLVNGLTCSTGAVGAFTVFYI